MKLKLSELKPNPFKKEINKGKLNEEIIQRIKSNIKELGLMGSLPIFKKEEEYYLIAGHHRVQALKETFGNNFEVEVTLHNYSNENILRGMVVENLTQRSDELLEVGENLNAIRNYLIASSTVETARDKFHKGKRYQVGIKEIYSWLNKNGEVMSIGKISQYLRIYDNLDRKLLEITHSNLDKKEEDVVNVREAIALSRLDKKEQPMMKRLLDKADVSSDTKLKLVTLYKNSPEEIKERIRKGELDIKELPEIISGNKPLPLKFEETINNIADNILSNLHSFKYNMDRFEKDNLADLSKSKASKLMTTAGLHIEIFRKLVDILRKKGTKPHPLILALIKANGKV
jgi:hypothetical protein